jgi:hypothetical protein
MQHYIQSVHMKLSYFTIQLQSSTHIAYYSHNNQKDLKLNLNRVLGGTTNLDRLLVEDYNRADGNNMGLAD